MKRMKNEVSILTKGARGNEGQCRVLSNPSKTSKTVKLRKSQSAYKIYHLWHSRPNGISIFNISMQIAMVNIAHTHNVKKDFENET